MASIEMFVEIDPDDAAEVLRADWDPQKIADEFGLYSEDEWSDLVDQRTEERERANTAECRVEELEKELQKYRLILNL